MLPGDAPADWDRPSGLRLGTIEVTRLGMKAPQMARIADLMARVLIEKEAPESVLEAVIEFREPYQKMYYCFDHGLPSAWRKFQRLNGPSGQHPGMGIGILSADAYACAHARGRARCEASCDRTFSVRTGDGKSLLMKRSVVSHPSSGTVRRLA